MKALPNYGKHEYTVKMQTFKESDRILEQDLHTLECYKNHVIEAPLNSFSDQSLNNHLYSMFKHKNLETPKVMRKLVTFFVKQYRVNLQPCIVDYLASKKMSLEDWLFSVGENRRGNILNGFLLCMVTGMHAFIHLQDGNTWSTLQTKPSNHDKILAL